MSAELPASKAADALQQLNTLQTLVSTLPPGFVRTSTEAHIQSLREVASKAEASATGRPDGWRGELQAARVTARTPLEAVSLAFHMLLRDKDFICNGTDEPSASTVKGFAAPVRDVSREQTFLLKVVQVGENEASAYLAESNGQTESLSLTLSDFADCLAAEDTIAAARSQFEDKCIKPFLPAPDAKQASTAPSTKEVTNTRRDEHDQDPLRVGPPRMPGPVPIPGMGPASPYPVHPGAIPGGVPGLGRGGDFNGDLMPGGPGLGPGMPGMTGGGLMGPDHPAFGGSGGSGLLPQPRFDPYGPPMPGIPGPGGLGRGRGGGRGNGNRFGGDPDPDHLPPPGAPGGAGGMGNMFF